ncbi:MAG: SLC13 family permease [Clostridia bacterium]
MKKLLFKLKNKLLAFREFSRVNFRPRLKKLDNYALKNWIVIFAVLAALVSCFFVKPDKQYLHYPEYKTLACLFSLLLILRALKHTKIFKIGAAKILEHIHNQRTLCLLLVFLPAFFALFITNDVATLSFVPFAIVLLSMANCEKLTPRVIILQTMACRLSGVISPLGNAQNLFLIDFYNFPPQWFIMNLWPLAVVGYSITLLGCLTIRRGEVSILPVGQYKIQGAKIAIYSALFVLTVLSIFNILPYLIVTPIVLLTILIVHSFAYRKVKYSIIVMFLAFFILAGNLQRIEGIDQFLTSALSGREYVLSVLASQILTNTPVALLFPNFTDAVVPLMLGINVGKFGAAQLSNFMVFNMYSKYDTSHNFGRKLLFVSFLYLFVLFGVGFLVIKFIN